MSPDKPPETPHDGKDSAVSDSEENYFQRYGIEVRGIRAGAAFAKKVVRAVGVTLQEAYDFVRRKKN